MKLYYLLTIINQTSFAAHPAVFPIALTDKGETYVTFSDLQQLKYIGTLFVIYVLWNIVVWLLNFFNKTEQKSKEKMQERLDKLEENSDKILERLNELSIRFAHVKDAQVTSDEVRAIARNEIEYVSKLRSK